MTKEHPILMQGPMVRALLAGVKTQTRRLVKPQPAAYPALKPEPRDGGRWVFMAHSDRPGYAFATGDVRCPYGVAGHRLWVRERGWMSRSGLAFLPLVVNEHPAGWRPTSPDGTAYKPCPSIHMPRWACRILLEVTAVRVERLQAISKADAIAEGILELVPPTKRSEGLTPAAMAFAAAAAVESMAKPTRRGFLAGALAAALGFTASPSRPWEVAPGRITRAPSARELYGVLWESINGAGSWDANPWVWVVEFRRVP